MERPDEVEPLSLAQNDVLGYLEMDYANGARVLFWPTDIAESAVSFTASSFGGMSQVEVGDLTEAEYGVPIIERSGLGGYDQVTVDRILSGRLVGLAPYINRTLEGVGRERGSRGTLPADQSLDLSTADRRRCRFGCHDRSSSSGGISRGHTSPSGNDRVAGLVLRTG